MVDVYTTEFCPACNLTKKALEKSGIPYTTSDLECIRAEAKAKGILVAPVVVVDGEIAWGGFRPDRIKALAS
jgi:glutaredoxin-like protein NrdH